MKAKLVKHESGYILYDEDNITIGAEPNVLSSDVFSKLSLKNCQTIENGYDLDELISAELEKLPYTKHLDDGQYNDGKLVGFEFGAYWGFQKALDLMGDKKFSEEDVISMIEKSRETGLTAEYLILTKQQTEWDVTYNPEELDADGCLILKTFKSE